MYRKLIILAAFLTFAVVVLGAYVRLSDAGLGCPDWPGCYGHVTPAHAAENIAAAEAAQPQGPVSFLKAWKEMVHRYFASTLGLLIITIAAIGWAKRKVLRQSPVLPLALIAVVVFQGLLGKWTVTLLLKPVIVTSHLLGGLTVLSLLTWLALRQFGPKVVNNMIVSATTRRLARMGLVVLVMQVILGGWVSTNYAGLACSDLPLCQGHWVPPMDFSNAFHLIRELGMTADGDLLSFSALTAIHWMHRLGALLTTLVLGILVFRLLHQQRTRHLGLALLGALTLQIAIGIANVYLSLPLWLAVAHNAGAAILIVTMITVNFALRCLPIVERQTTADKHPSIAATI